MLPFFCSSGFLLLTAKPKEKGVISIILISVLDLFDLSILCACQVAPVATA